MTPLILNISSKLRREVSFTLNLPTLGKTEEVTQWIGDWMDVTVGLVVCRRENFLALTGNRTTAPIIFFHHSNRSLVTIPTELSRLKTTIWILNAMIGSSLKFKACFSNKLIVTMTILVFQVVELRSDLPHKPAVWPVDLSTIKYQVLSKFRDYLTALESVTSQKARTPSTNNVYT